MREVIEADTVMGKFPTVSVDMDTPLNLGTEITVTMTAKVKEIRHELVSGEVRRIHIFEVETMSMSVDYDDDHHDHVVCSQCAGAQMESEGVWVGSLWVCRSCVESAAPWVHSNEAVLDPTPLEEMDEE